MALLKDWFGWEGPFTAGERRKEELHQSQIGGAKNTEMNSLLSIIRSDAADDIRQQAAVKLAGLLSPELRNKYAQASQSALRPTAATDSEANEILKQINALGTARGKFEDEEGVIDPSVAPFLDSLGAELNIRGQQYIETKSDQRTIREDRPDPLDVSIKAGKKLIGEAKKTKTDNRSMFGGQDIAFSRIPSTRELEKNLLPQAPAADFIQTATAAFPRSTVPPTYQQIGLTAKDDIEQFAELEKKLPDINLRAVYQDDPQGFAAILKALRTGQDPRGNPFTIKDAIALIQKIQ